MLFKSIKTSEDVAKLKRKIVKDDEVFKRILRIRKESKFRGGLILSHKSKTTPSNAEVLALYKELVKSGKEKQSTEIEQLLRKTKTKSNSGIVSVSLLTKPFPCPGKCIYCPTEKQMPKSYLSLEPAAARALRNNFDPYKQVETRLRALEVNGHPVDKIEIIVIGGTWSFYDKKYQDYFISEIFRACNNFKSRKKIKKKLNLKGSLKREKNLNELQKINEKAKNRVIGLSVETRPDFITLDEIKRMRELGVTKVEIGIQHLDDKILEANKRGIDVSVIAKATKLLRVAGIKIVYHMMPNLYGSTPAKDVKMFKQLFSDPRFFPDMLKIYPCVVLEKTGLHKLWKEKKFKPYSDKQLKELLIKVKKDIPPYTRIIRLIRDIPASYIIAGSKISNLRQIILEGENKVVCRCIRCREIREDVVDPKKFKLNKINYGVAGGEEVFLSFDKKLGGKATKLKLEGKLAAFLRLFLPDGFDETLPVLNECAIIRELHTYGRLVSFNKKGDQSQHIGFGKKLIAEAEKIAKRRGFKNMAVISGVGVRGYYRKLGYKLKDTYMVKGL